MKNHPPDQSFKERLATLYPRLGRQRQRVAMYVNDNLQNAVFLTANQLARQVGVDAGTVVRTAQSLGYRGYGDFIENARRCFLETRTPYEIVQRSVQELADPEQSVMAALHRERENLRELIEGVNAKQIVRLARRIRRARCTVIVGVDMASTLSLHLEFMLQMLGFNARAASSGGARLRNQLLTIKPGDLMIAITFRRGLRETVEAARTAREEGTYTVGITDSQLSPLVKVCDECVLAPVASQFFATYVAPLALLDALILALIKCDPSHSLKALGKMKKEYESGNRWC